MDSFFGKAIGGYVKATCAISNLVKKSCQEVRGEQTLITVILLIIVVMAIVMVGVKPVRDSLINVFQNISNSIGGMSGQSSGLGWEG